MQRGNLGCGSGRRREVRRRRQASGPGLRSHLPTWVAAAGSGRSQERTGSGVFTELKPIRIPTLVLPRGDGGVKERRHA
jgi:hypothetical protein